MHLRLAQRARGERHLAPRRQKTLLVVLLGAAAAGTALAGCTRQAPSAADVRVEWRVSPAPPALGPAVLRVFIVDGAGQPVAGARLRVEGHMTHPGMAPATAALRETAAGTYEAPLTFTMAGDWVLVLEGALDDGRALRRQLSVPGVRPSR